MIRSSASNSSPAFLLIVTSLACGVDGRNDAAQTAGIDPTVGSAGGGTEAGDSSTSSTGAADPSGPDEGEGDGSESAGADDPLLPKFDIAYNPGDPAAECMAGPNDDQDNDGWTKAQGDCNDCDEDVNPSAVEVVVTEPDDTGMIPAPADENCDGLVDNLAPPCDDGLDLDENDPLRAANAIGLCRVAAGPTDWGIVDAQWVRADGSPLGGGNLQYGFQTQWGDNVAAQEGETMLVLSSGHARTPGQQGSCDSLTCYGVGAGNAPNGFPQDVPACAGSLDINDDVALEVTLRAPSNATGFSYNFDFYSFEYPEWVCTSFNDQYIALVEPAPEGSVNGNISFDSMLNPVSVNIAFFEVCQACNLGTAELDGTGFDVWDDAGATSWLVTTAPVEGGEEFTIRFAIWDTGDHNLDSSVLVDAFQWIASGGTVKLETKPPA